MPDWCGVREAADVGMFAQSLMLALTAHGLASCPQSSLSHYAAVVKRELNIPDDMRLLFGLSFGYEDPDHPSNLVRTSRLPIEEARSEDHTSELQSLMRISYAVFCFKKKKTHIDS